MLNSGKKLAEGLSGEIQQKPDIIEPIWEPKTLLLDVKDITVYYHRAAAIVIGERWLLKRKMAILAFEDH